MIINGFNVKKDIRGKKFGRLLAIEPICKGKKRYILWKFSCDCGKDVILIPYNVVSGHTLSCGCFHKEQLSKMKRGPEGEAILNSLYSNYKTAAKRRNLEFSLSKKEFKEITTKNCFYCGKIPSSKHKRKYFMVEECIYNGIDRVDNLKGYIIENCVPCCKTCNIAKHDMKVEDFISWIKDIYFHLELYNDSRK